MPVSDKGKLTQLKEKFCGCSKDKEIPADPCIIEDSLQLLKQPWDCLELLVIAQPFILPEG